MQIKEYLFKNLEILFIFYSYVHRYKELKS